ncbi:MAG: transcription termination/antitermination protein NusG [Bacteroidales bacterium]|nr:transcription termination/antitermination protein NusG [Bacteroidales bacterium]
MAQAEMAWYVLRAISGKEGKVKEYIDAEIKNGRLGGHVSQVLIPTEKVKQVKGNKQVVKERLYLPGYVLVEARLVGETIHELRNTPNVLGFLGGMDNPTPLRESEVNRILGKVDELEDIPQEIEIPFVVGENVKVTDGPFSGFSGVVEKVDDEKKKVTVNVKVFGRSTGLDLGFMQVEKE